MSLPERYDIELDRGMEGRAAAFSAMEFLRNYPDECVPVLIEALDSFEEFDPDHGYYGPGSRVADALSEFGPQARAATLPLARFIAAAEPDEYPSAVVRALIKIDPVDPQLLPILEDYRKRSDQDPDADEGEAESDPIGYLINRLRSWESN
jgi:hypothetical protein